MKLSEDLSKWRAERPDEWTMDRFIGKAKNLENDRQAAIDVIASAIDLVRYFYCEAEISNSGEVVIPNKDEDGKETRFFKKINEFEGKAKRVLGEMLVVFE